MLSLSREGFSKGGMDTWADLKCEGKEPSVSDRLITDVIGVIKVSMQSYTRLVDIGSKSEDLHGARRTRWRTSSTVTQLRFCRTFLESGGFNTQESVRREGRANDRNIVTEKRAESVFESGNRRIIRKVYFRATV